MNATLRFSTGLVSWLALLFNAGAAASQPLALTSVQPAAGAPGDRVELHGHGFGRPAASYFAWGFDGTRGYVLDVTRKISKTQLGAVVGDLHADVEGPVVLWRGRRSRVAPFTIGGGLYTVREAVVFRPDTAAEEGPSFAATAGSTPGSAGRLAGGAIRLDLTLPSSVSTASLRLTAEEEEDPDERHRPPIDSYAVEGSGESCGPPEGSGDGDKESGFGFSFRIECRDQQLCQANPAALLAAAFAGVLGSSGVEATVEGSTVVLSQDQPLCAAALNVTMSPALARDGSGRPQGGDLLASSPDRSSDASSS